MCPDEVKKDCVRIDAHTVNLRSHFERQLTGKSIIRRPTVAV